MISPERPNAKALHELLHYYMQERYVKGNMEVRRLIICNIHEWYIFDASDFEQFFFRNKKFVEIYQKWNDGLFSGDKTDWLYREILKPFVENELETLPCTYFNLKEYARSIRNPEGEDDKKLIALYKLLSPLHLLKQSFANDTNSLNREFYNELLHILGLEEIKDKGKKLINRKATERRNEESLLENAINILKVRNKLAALDNPEQFGEDEDEQYFSLGLELCITWLNRILFLKLLEGQLRAYHRGNREYAFLNTRRIADFDELEELFFEVLARKNNDRAASVQEKFGDIPYLNSSLFEESDLERTTIHIAALKGRLDLEHHGATVLKDSVGRRLTGKMNTLQYLFEFLDAYDFSSEGGAEIQEVPRTIINASVLGLIFEKINGYRDGSFYTPGFITMYICRETIRRAVVAQFRQSNLPGFQKLAGFDELRDMLDSSDREVRKRANAIINNVTVCDPAVGSGHFLVSALNELIAVKSEMGLLSYRDNGDRIKEYGVSVENDELIVIDKDDDSLFAYTLNRNNRPIAALQRLQETLFHEKENIIENCLFGVDINPKSVAICRLRLWIELLKNTYYTRDSGYAELETLPNIDINIKCGNSLVSRFALSGNQNVLPTDRKKLKELTEKYKMYVTNYKISTPATTTKSTQRKFIEDIKLELERFADPTDKDLIDLRKLKNELDQLGFGFTKKETDKRHDLEAKEEELKRVIEEKRRTLYGNAFEWRFEFPEVLDVNGDFAGFDAIIGNPPYIRIQDLKESAPNEAALYKNRYLSASKGNYDIYVMFVEQGLTLLNERGRLGYILPHKFFNAQYGESLRKLVSAGGHLSEIVHFGHEMIFDEAAAYTCLLFLDRQRSKQFRFIKVEDLIGWRNGAINSAKTGTLPSSAATAADWNFSVGGSGSLLARLTAMPLTLEQATERIFQGLKTSADKIYIVEERERTENEVLIYSPEKQTEYRLEPDLLHPLVKGGDSSAYRLGRTSRLILFPYETGTDGKVALISAESLQKRYPLTWDYFTVNREYLEDRENGKMRHVGWYGYVYPKALEVMPLPKIFIPDLAPEPRFSLDATGECFFTGGTAGGYGILVKQGYDRRYILGILNSRLCGWFISQTATQMRGGWRSYEARFIRHIPIHPVNSANSEEQARHDRIVVLVDQMLAAKNNINQTSEVSKTSEVFPPTDIPALEAEIDRLVYALYSLTEEEIAVVEGKK